MAGGFYRPPKKVLDSLRAAIDYNGEELRKILNDPSFKDSFEELIKDERLKTAPKGYSQEHRHIDLLRNKSFAVMHSFTQKEVMQEDFQDKIIELYKKMLPFRRYLNRAVTV